MGEKHKKAYSNQEFLGINKVESIVLEQFNWIFRRLPSPDVGIDAIIEKVVEGDPKCEMMLVQIKSYTKKINTPKVYYPTERHLDYWLNGNLPTILVCHYQLCNDEGIIEDECVRWAPINNDTIIKNKKGYKINLDRDFGISDKDFLSSLFSQKYVAEISEIHLLNGDNEKERLENKALSIEEVRIKLKREGDGSIDYVYPLISTGKSSVDIKIYESMMIHLSNFGFYEEMKRMNASDTLDYFKNYFIENFNSGISDISYEVNHFHGDIVSIRLNVTTVGAYPLENKDFFIFDIKSGNRLRVDDLFRESKKSEIVSLFLKKKQDEIKKVIDELKLSRDEETANAISIELKESDMEDSEENRIMIGDTSIYFYPKYSFTRCLRVLEPQEPISFTFDDLAPYIDPNSILGITL